MDSRIIEHFTRKPNAPTLAQVREHFCMSNGITPESEQMAIAFFNKWEAVGWYNGHTPIVNFKPLADTFAMNWRNNRNKVAPKKEGWKDW